jgi:hypothetical protein
MAEDQRTARRKGGSRDRRERAVVISANLYWQLDEKHVGKDQGKNNRPPVPLK